MFCFEVWFSAKTASFHHISASLVQTVFSHLWSASLHHIIYWSSPLHILQIWVTCWKWFIFRNLFFCSQASEAVYCAPHPCISVLHHLPLLLYVLVRLQIVVELPTFPETCLLTTPLLCFGGKSSINFKTFTSASWLERCTWCSDFG